MTTVIRTIPAILAALFAATATFTVHAADRSWNSESTGGSKSPYNIWDTSSAGWNGSIGKDNNLHFNLAEKTYFNSGSGTQIANDFIVESGDYVFTGPLYFLALKAGAANKTVSITKKNGNWTIHQYGFFLGNANYSTVVFTNESGNVTCTGTGNDKFYIGYAESSKGELVNLDGEISFGGNLNFGLWTKNTSTLTVEGGTVTVNSGHSVDFRTGTCTINLNGGTLTTKQVKNNLARGTVTGTINFNGGTLKANAVDSNGLIKTGVAVTVGAGGGTIDCDGHAVSINAPIGGTGGLTFTGGNTIAISNITYTGITTITPGTRLAVSNLGSSKNLISQGIVVAGVPAHGDVIFTCTRGEGYTLEGVNLDNVKCPLAPNTKFELDDSKTNIVVTSVGTSLAPAFWTGAANDGNLSNPANWTDNAVPGPGTNATILCATPATLTNGAGFAPSAITFASGSSAVTIDGDDITGIVAVTNLSSASHTINAKVYFAGNIQVKQAAMAGRDENFTKVHVTFAGGAYAAEGCSLENANSAPVYSRCIFGEYFFANTTGWTASYTSNNDRRHYVAEGSRLYIPRAGNMQELYIGTNAQVTVGSMALDSGRPCFKNYGEMVVTNLTATGSTDIRVTNGQGTSTPGVFKFGAVTNKLHAGTGALFYFADAYDNASIHVFYIGEGGLNFDTSVSGQSSIYVIGRENVGNHETIRPWHSDFTIGARPGTGNPAGLRFFRDVEFCTDDENGTGRTITLEARTQVQANKVAAITVSGTGTLKVTQPDDNGAQPTVTLTDSATLEYTTADATLGTGAMTLGAGTTLALTSASSTFTAISNAVTLPTEGKAKIRIDGQRLRSGPHTILSNVTGSADNVEIDLSGTALGGRKRASFSVDGTNLILTINPTGTVIIVR